MKILVKKIVTRTYDEEFRTRLKNLIRDLVILFVLILVMIKVEELTAGKHITLFEVQYRLDLILFYLIGFVFILTSSHLLIDVRNFMNIIARYVITRFPRMQGDFGPGKKIFRDMVQILVLFLLFYPFSTVIKESFTFFGHEIQLLVIFSILFLILSLLFVYDIFIQILRMLATKFKAPFLIKYDPASDKEYK
jgi:hypothetical protein